MDIRSDVAPPGREEQVKALKGKVENPYAVAWASYNGDDMYDECDEDSDLVDLHQHKGHKVGPVHELAGVPGHSEPDEDEDLLDTAGEHLPHEVAAPKDPPAHAPEPHGIKDPDPLK